MLPLAHTEIVISEHQFSTLRGGSMANLLSVFAALVIGGWYLLKGTINNDNSTSYISEHEKLLR